MHSGAVCSVDALQSLLVPYVTLANRGFLDSTHRVLSGLSRQVEDRRNRRSEPAPPPEGTARASAATRTAHNASKKPHAIDATRHDTSYALRNYTVFGRFRFVVDDRDDDDRGFR